MKPPAEPPDPRPCHGGSGSLSLTRASLCFVLPIADQQRRLHVAARCDPVAASEASSGRSVSMMVEHSRVVLPHSRPTRPGDGGWSRRSTWARWRSTILRPRSRAPMGATCGRTGCTAAAWRRLAALPVASCGGLSCWGILPEVARDVATVLAIAAAFEVLDFTISSSVGCRQQTRWCRMLLRRHDGCERQISLHKGVDMASIQPLLGSASAGPVRARAGSGGTSLPRGSIPSMGAIWWTPGWRPRGHGGWICEVAATAATCEVVATAAKSGPASARVSLCPIDGVEGGATVTGCRATCKTTVLSLHQTSPPTAWADLVLSQNQDPVKTHDLLWARSGNVNVRVSCPC